MYIPGGNRQPIFKKNKTLNPLEKEKPDRLGSLPENAACSLSSKGTPPPLPRRPGVIYAVGGWGLSGHVLASSWGGSEEVQNTWDGAETRHPEGPRAHLECVCTCVSSVRSRPAEPQLGSSRPLDGGQVCPDRCFQRDHLGCTCCPRYQFNLLKSSFLCQSFCTEQQPLTSLGGENIFPSEPPPPTSL